MAKSSDSFSFVYVTFLLFGQLVSISSQQPSVSTDPNDVHFYLYPSLSNPNVSQEIVYNDVASLTSSSFQYDQKIIFLIHGFQNDYTAPMEQSIKNAYMAQNINNNYILVDWGALAQPKPIGAPISYGLYAICVGNVPIVGTRVADFINFLMTNNFSGEIHIIGHSLGAHVSGFAGQNMQEVYGTAFSRITGLDPAGPLFFPPISCRNLVKGDAQFVDIIHTNAGIYGDTTKDGDVDFYPNGGSFQPNCGMDSLPVLSIVEDIGTGCSHGFAFQLYAASLTYNFNACPCYNLVKYFCPANCAPSRQVLMGYNCPTNATGNYYVKTSNPL